MDCWLPYNFNLIMQRGHAVNTVIPEDPAMAEFPDFPWEDEVTILIKSSASLPVLPDPTTVDGSSGGPPSSWVGSALGSAPPIDPDAAALVGYSSPNTGQDGSTLGDLPIDQELLRLRGLSNKDEEIHRMIGLTTRKDYPLLIGVSLPVPDRSFDRAHEAQLWEETDENWIIEDDHAAKRLSVAHEQICFKINPSIASDGAPYFSHGNGSSDMERWQSRLYSVFTHWHDCEQDGYVGDSDIVRI
jgi:hypothetical protein